MSKKIVLLDGPQNWEGQSMESNPCWQYFISQADIEEIDWALKSVKQSGQTVISTAVEDFPLNSLGETLSVISNELENGCGFCRIRGMPLNRWNKTEIELIWMGIANHIGKPVYQNSHGQLLREIKAEEGDVGERYGKLDTCKGQFLSSRARTASNAELRFHTDRCDIVGLLCTGKASMGGLSRVASSVAVHNKMLEIRSDLCALLYNDLPRSRMGEEAGGEAIWYLLPVWSIYNGKFSSHYSRTFIEALEHVPGAPQVTEEQWLALDLLGEIADEVALSMTLNPGDIQFINNHVIYHARTNYVDDPVNGHVRSLLRVWLSAPHRALPEGHRVLWQEVETGRFRGGIVQSTGRG